MYGDRPSSVDAGDTRAAERLGAVVASYTIPVAAKTA
ncbi:MAG: hypothetical protein A07HB70_01984 [uncultured archaeon A07HB70]|nr:MAG: hypothetical protein A07HB70_01984 [uncultured archaeon A07HB70]